MATSGCSIRELAALVKRVVAYEGKIIWDEEKPDGTPQKLLDVPGVQTMGWRPRIGAGGRDPHDLWVVLRDAI